MTKALNVTLSCSNWNAGKVTCRIRIITTIITVAAMASVVIIMITLIICRNKLAVH